MLNAIDKARPELSPFAPRILRMKINPEKIGAVIGPGGKQIREIQSTCKVEIEIEDDGTVTIACAPGGDAEKAQAIVRGLTEDVEVGKIYLGTVKRIVDFGAFVEILPGKEGLVRIGDLAEYRVNRSMTSSSLATRSWSWSSKSTAWDASTCRVAPFSKGAHRRLHVRRLDRGSRGGPGGDRRYSGGGRSSSGSPVTADQPQRASRFEPSPGQEVVSVG